MVKFSIWYTTIALSFLGDLVLWIDWRVMYFLLAVFRLHFIRSLVWGHFCLCYEGHKLINDKSYIRSYGIKEGDQVCMFSILLFFCFLFSFPIREIYTFLFFLAIICASRWMVQSVHTRSKDYCLQVTTFILVGYWD